jgi:hypothetical protein
MESITEALGQYYIHNYNYQESDSMSHTEDEYYDDNYYPNLGKLTIDDILTQDDPPKELYLMCDLLEYVEEEYILEMLFKEEYFDTLHEIETSFDIYQHFGIYDDDSDCDREALLEAAMSGYEK